MSKADRTDIATIIIMAILAFGLQIPWLGFFQDDWNFVFYASSRGSQGLLDFLFVDGRPGASWVYMLGFTLFGYKPWLWQLFSLILRLSTTITFWYILNTLWPQRRYGNLVASIFFLTYPFFTLQPLSVAYAPHFMAYFLYALSMFFMVRALQRPEKYLSFTIPAVLLALVQLLTVEYFVGLELLRIFVLWFLLSRSETSSPRQRLKKVFIQWLPYLIVLLFFVAWRSFVLPQMGARHDPISEVLESGQTLLSVAKNVLADWVLMAFSSWFKLIDPGQFVIGPIRNFYIWVSIVTGAVCFYFLGKTVDQDEAQSNDLKGTFLAGLLIFMTGMIAIYGAGYVIHVKISPWNSRFALPALLGLALMSSGLIETLITSKTRRHFFLAVVMGLLIGWHNHNTLEFKSAWEKQSRLYEQLIWRAPSIKPNTAIIASEEILGYMGDYPTSYGINTMYEAKGGGNAPLWFFALSENMNFSTVEAAEASEIQAQRGIVSFQGDSQNAIFISYEPENQECLWVLRPEDSEYKYLPAQMKEGALFSQVENILPDDTDHSLYHQIVRENKDTWCYFYQKADLARQTGDSQRVIKLWQEAQARGFQPANGFEYIPFIEASALEGKWEQAFLLTKQASKVTKAMYTILCPTWDRLAQRSAPSEEKDRYLHEAYEMLKCVSDQ